MWRESPLVRGNVQSSRNWLCRCRSSGATRNHPDDRCVVAGKEAHSWWAEEFAKYRDVGLKTEWVLIHPNPWEKEGQVENMVAARLWGSTASLGSPGNPLGLFSWKAIPHAFVHWARATTPTG